MIYHIAPTWGIRKTYCGIGVAGTGVKLKGISGATCPTCVNNSIIASARVGQVADARKMLSLRKDIVTQDTIKYVEGHTKERQGNRSDRYWESIRNDKG